MGFSSGFSTVPLSNQEIWGSPILGNQSAVDIVHVGTRPQLLPTSTTRLAKNLAQRKAKTRGEVQNVMCVCNS